MAAPDHTTSQPAKTPRNIGSEPETCLDSFLAILENLSEATGLSIEDIADLLSGKDGPMGAMVLAGHMQATNGARIAREQRDREEAAKSPASTEALRRS